MRKPETPPELTALPSEEIMQLINRGLFDPAPAGRYRHWDTLRRVPPPADVTSEAWWFAVKMARVGLYKRLDLLDRSSRAFVFGMPDVVIQLVHEIDRSISGRGALPTALGNPEIRDYYVVNALIEESITSSQLEGAATTRRVAEQMLRSGRAPQDHSERMILNNYNGMNYVRELQGDLTAEKVLKLHRILTEGTLDDSACGKLRKRTDDIVVHDQLEGQVLHVPPDASELPTRLTRLCTFANTTDGRPFVHPVVRAILLHFWLAYDHPFVDGNGRTARALFYWAMLRQGYQLAEFLSISPIIKRAPTRYAKSFLYAESDGNDATYFILSQLAVIRQGIRDLTAHLDRKTKEIKGIEAMMRRSSRLNHRQLALVSHAIKHAGAEYTIESHMVSHRVVYQTARTDLLDLAQQNLLLKVKTGRKFVFQAPADLTKRLKKI